jgi:hypothetical protein
MQRAAAIHIFRTIDWAFQRKRAVDNAMTDFSAGSTANGVTPVIQGATVLVRTGLQGKTSGGSSSSNLA